LRNRLHSQEKRVNAQLKHYPIFGVNDPPTARPNSYSTTENFTTHGVSLSGNAITDNTGAGVDSDPDTTPTPDILRAISIAGSNSSSINARESGTVSTTHGASVTMSSNGNFTYDTGTAFDSLSGGASATDSFTYTISNGHGGTSTATVPITINNNNVIG
jgi:VCBS repeat-containing protein